MKSIFFSVLVIIPFFSTSSFADHGHSAPRPRRISTQEGPVLGGGANLPGGLQCFDSDKRSPLPVGNAQVLGWLKNSQDQFTHRALVQGVVIKRYPDRTDHAHFSIDLNGDGQGDLEVIYQNGFGALPALQSGMTIAVCGDYITDHAHSPNGGIIHWLHCNPGNRDAGLHANGFVVINGKVYGFQAPMSEPPCSIH